MGSLVNLDQPQFDVVTVDDLPTASKVNQQDFIVVNQGAGKKSESTKAKLSDVFEGTINESRNAAREAEDSAKRAAASADLAGQGKDAYQTPEEAQQAIDSGKETRRYFPVYRYDGKVWVERFENVNGVATPTGTTMATGYYISTVDQAATEAKRKSRNIQNINGLTDELNRKIIGGIGDESLRLPLHVNNHGDTFVSGLKVINLEGSAGVVFTDKYFRPYACSAGYENKEGLPVIGGVNSNNRPFKKIPLTSVMGIHTGGQSLSKGVTSKQKVKIVTDAQPYSNQMFSSGIRSSTPETDTAAPLVESNFVLPGFENFPQSETYLSSLVNGFTERLMKDKSITDHTKLGAKFFGAAEGVAGLKLVEISKGTDSWKDYVKYVNNAMRLANQSGKAYAELCEFYSQGESDYRDSTNPEEWERMLLRYIDDKNALAKSVTGQDFDKIFIAAQLASHKAYQRVKPTMALSLRKLAHQGHMQLSYPAYIGLYVDSVHMSPDEYIYCGKLAARCLSRAFKNNQAGKPFGINWLAVTNYAVQGVVHELTYNVPTPPLRIKTDWVWETKNYGFEVVNKNTMTTVDIISSVSVTGEDRVTVITSRPLNVDEILVYGWGVDSEAGKSGRVNGPRGNICDSSGDLPGESYTDSVGVLRPMDDYAEIWSSEEE